MRSWPKRYLQIAQREFAGVQDGDHRCFRIKTLTNEEILAFLSLWDQSTDGTELALVEVIVAGDAGAAFPEKFKAQSGRSITYYRNHNPGGLIYLETKTESDEQGLKNIYTLRDVDLLRGAFDSEDENFSVSSTMVEKAWKVAVDNTRSAPVLLKERITDVLSCLQVSKPVSARQYLAFAISAVQEYRTLDSSLDAHQTDALVGRNLFYSRPVF